MKFVVLIFGFLLINSFDGSSLFAQFNKSTRFTLEIKVSADDSIKVIFHVNEKTNIDSIKLYFFKVNGYLRQPIIDSIRHIHDSMRLVLYLLLVHEVEIPFSIPVSGSVFRSGPKIIAVFHKSEFKKLVTEMGGLDNVTQLQTGFQLFVKVFLRRNRNVEIASNIFRL